MNKSVAFCGTRCYIINRGLRDSPKLKRLRRGMEMEEKVIKKLVQWGVKEDRAKIMVKENYRYCGHLSTVSKKADFCWAV